MVPMKSPIPTGAPIRARSEGGCLVVLNSTLMLREKGKRAIFMQNGDKPEAAQLIRQTSSQNCNEQPLFSDTEVERGLGENKTSAILVRLWL